MLLKLHALRFPYSKRLQTVYALFVMIVGIGFCSGCKHISVAHPVAPGLVGDSIRLISVQHVDGGTLDREKPMRLIVRLAYNLTSHETANLALGLVQFRDKTSCVSVNADANNNEMLGTVAEGRIPIQRGLHVLEIPIIWPGDTGVGTQGNIFSQGTISLNASMLSDRPEYKFLTVRFGTEYCDSF